MLRIVLLIFKIFGIVLLSILGFALFITLLVLFVPIRYKVKAKKEDETWLKARVKWLFGILSIKCDYKDEKFTYSARICGKLIVSDKPKKKKKRQKKKLIKEKKANNVVEHNENLTIDKPMIKNSDKTKSESVILSKTGPIINEKTVAEEKTDHFNQRKIKPNKFVIAFNKIKGIPKHLNSLIHIIKDKFKSITLSIKGVLEKLSKMKAFLKDQTNRAGFKKAWMYLKRILSHIKPRKLVMKLRFGTGDPASTGQLLGAIYAVYPPVIHKLQLQPDFDEKRFEGELYARGRIRVFTILVIGIKVIRDKDIKNVRNNIMKLKEEL